MKTLLLILLVCGTSFVHAQRHHHAAADLGLQSFHRLATSDTLAFATGTKNAKSDVIVRFGTITPSVIIQAEPAPSILTVGIIQNPSEQIVIGLLNEIRARNAGQWEVLYSQNTNRRNFLYAGSSESSVILVAKSDTVLGSDTNELGVPVSKIAREIEIWSAKESEAILVQSFDSNSRVQEITVPPLIFENTIYIPFFARSVSDPSRIISIADTGIAYITTPEHPTIQHRDAAAVTISDDSLLVFVYLGGATYTGQVVPNVVMTFNPFTREFDIAENEYDWRVVSSVCAIQGRLFVSTDLGVYAGPLHSIHRFDLKELGQDLPSYPWIRDMKCDRNTLHFITSDAYYRVPILTSTVLADFTTVTLDSYHSFSEIACATGASIVDLRGQVVRTCRNGESISVSGLSNALYILLQPGLEPRPFVVLP